MLNPSGRIKLYARNKGPRIVLPHASTQWFKSVRKLRWQSAATLHTYTDVTSQDNKSQVLMPPGVSEHYYEWTVPGSTLGTRVRYFKAGDSGPLILLLHGFGVGAYHYERNIGELAKACQVFAVDVLGQGSSWPLRPATPEDSLYISIDTWRKQIYDFAVDIMKAGPKREGEEEAPLSCTFDNTREVNQGPIYVAGNSLGGLLAVQLAAMHPNIVKGVILLNATPFWSFRPSLNSPNKGLWSMAPDGFGSVPVPKGLKSLIERAWWDNLRSPTTIRSMLQLVYNHSASVDEDTVKRIVEATEQPLALDVFAAIALAPKPELSFDECLARLHQLPVLMLYGREDPWVVPLWGRRLKRRLPEAIYLELSPAGHCPHHEVPKSVNFLILSWLESGHVAPIPEGEELDIEEQPGRVVKVRNLGDGRKGSSPSNFLSRILDFFDS